MKLTERIELLKQSYGPASHHEEGYSISDKPINEFIAKLAAQGVVIDTNSSEQKIAYRSKRGGERRKATVPFGTTLPENTGFVVAYYLQGTGEGDSRHTKYELKLKDHSATGSSGGRIGGSVGGEYGIVCTLTVEGQKIDTSIVDSVRKALHETYVPPVVMSEQQKAD